MKFFHAALVFSLVCSSPSPSLVSRQFIGVSKKEKLPTNKHGHKNGDLRRNALVKSHIQRQAHEQAKHEDTLEQQFQQEEDEEEKENGSTSVEDLQLQRLEERKRKEEQQEFLEWAHNQAQEIISNGSALRFIRATLKLLKKYWTMEEMAEMEDGDFQRATVMAIMVDVLGELSEVDIGIGLHSLFDYHGRFFYLVDLRARVTDALQNMDNQ